MPFPLSFGYVAIGETLGDTLKEIKQIHKNSTKNLSPKKRIVV
jgi:hypothetical protein